MLEVGRLKNYSESRTHFSAWAVMSSPLILSFDLRVDKVRALTACLLSLRACRCVLLSREAVLRWQVMDAMWPIISNRDVLAVNQRWAGHPGTRLGYTGAVNGNVGNSSQVWAKPLGNTSFAVLFMSTGPGESPRLRSFEQRSQTELSVGSQSRRTSRCRSRTSPAT